MTKTVTSNSFKPQRLLKSELQRRCEKNPGYSIRAFAKTLGVSHTFLSMLLKGDRPFTPKMLHKLSDVLNLDPKQRTQLLSSNNEITDDSSLQISVDTFSVISDWYHYGILNLMKLRGFRSNTKWIAKRLGVSELQVSLAIERLKRIKFIDEDTNGNWYRLIPDIKVDNQNYSSACKKFQSQVLEKAKGSLADDPFDQRAMESFTLVMDSSQIPYARKRLREVSKELSAELEKLGKHNEVYNLAIQIYPISKSNRGN